MVQWNVAGQVPPQPSSYGAQVRTHTAGVQQEPLKQRSPLAQGQVIAPHAVLTTVQPGTPLHACDTPLQH